MCHYLCVHNYDILVAITSRLPLILSSLSCFRFTVRHPLIGIDGITSSSLFLSHSNFDDDGLKARCHVAYQADTEKNFFGGTVTSGDMVLKIAQATEFTASNAGPIKGEKITLTCIATGVTAPSFEFTFGMNNWDNSVYEEVKSVEVSSDGTTHTAKYEVIARSVNTLRNGQKIDCTVSKRSDTTHKNCTVDNFSFNFSRRKVLKSKMVKGS